jgi:hypothetical protein
MQVVEGRLLGVVASVAVVVCMAIWGAASVGASRADHSPDVIQLSYSETRGDVGADKFLGVFSRHTHAVHFSAQKRRVKSAAPGRYRPDITDTDIHGRKARHPWVPNRKEGGQGVIALVHHALHHSGAIKVRVRARKAGVVDDVRVRLSRKHCTSTPAYPLDCEVKVD